tara:strand:- start:250 stop:390 length:141 start_codon:yes stop_codon:yes gene_type:complete
MPVIKTATGYKFGAMGKVFKTRAEAEAQGRKQMQAKRGGKRGGRRK